MHIAAKSYKIFMGPALGGALLLLSCPVLARSVYLNGVDISSARNQPLANVSLRIDENGNIFIDAPHYAVKEEDSFTPLSQYAKDINTKHRPLQALPRIDRASKEPLADSLDQPVGKVDPGAKVEAPKSEASAGMKPLMGKADTSTIPPPALPKESSATGPKDKPGSKLPDAPQP